MTAPKLGFSNHSLRMSWAFRNWDSPTGSDYDFAVSAARWCNSLMGICAIEPRLHFQGPSSAPFFHVHLDHATYPDFCELHSHNSRSVLLPLIISTIATAKKSTVRGAQATRPDNPLRMLCAGSISDRQSSDLTIHTSLHSVAMHVFTIRLEVRPWLRPGDVQIAS